MTFVEYLVQKKIDGKAFRQADQVMFEQFKSHFELLHPKSFTAQKLYLINGIRRKYPLEMEDKSMITPVKKISRPLIKKKSIDTANNQEDKVISKPVIKTKAADSEKEASKKPKPIMKRPKMK